LRHKPESIRERGFFRDTRFDFNGLDFFSFGCGVGWNSSQNMTGSLGFFLYEQVSVPSQDTHKPGLGLGNINESFAMLCPPEESEDYRHTPAP